MRTRAMSVLGVMMGMILVSADTCETTAPPPDTCVEGQTLTVGTDVKGAVAGGDCLLPNGEGRHGDSYTFSVAAQTVIRFHVTGTTATALRVRDNGRTGEQDIALHDNGLTEFTTFVSLKPGSYTVDIAADEDDASGDYTISSSVLTPPQPSGCVQPPNAWRFMILGMTLSGEITATDCVASGLAKADNYNVKMFAGGNRKITVTVSAGAAVEVRMIDNPALVAGGPNGTRNTAGDIIIQFSPATTGYYNIGIIATPGSTAFTYTIKVE
jgi:hypothetical protein